jgi:hypothetical protein
VLDVSATAAGFTSSFCRFQLTLESVLLVHIALSDRAPPVVLVLANLYCLLLGASCVGFLLVLVVLANGMGTGKRVLEPRATVY